MFNLKVVCIGLLFCILANGKPIEKDDNGEDTNKIKRHASSHSSKLQDVFNSSDSEDSLSSKFLQANPFTDQPTRVPTDQQTYADIYESMSFQFPWRDDDDDSDYDSDEEDEDDNEISQPKVPVEHFEVVMVNANDQKTEEINTKLSANFRYKFAEPNDLLNKQIDDDSHNTEAAENETNVPESHTFTQTLGPEPVKNNTVSKTTEINRDNSIGHNEAGTTKSTDAPTVEKLFTSTALKNSSKHNNKTKMDHQESTVTSKDAEVTNKDEDFDKQKKHSLLPYKTTEAPKRRTTSNSFNNKQKCTEDNASIESIWEKIKNYLLGITTPTKECVEAITHMPRVERNHQFRLRPRNFMFGKAYL